MFTIQSLTGARFAGAAAGWGIFGIAVVVSGMLNFNRFGWRLAFVIAMASVLFALAVFNFRVFLKLTQLRAETPRGELPRVPMRTFGGWLLANVVLLVLVVILGVLFSLTG